MSFNRCQPQQTEVAKQVAKQVVTTELSGLCDILLLINNLGAGVFFQNIQDKVSLAKHDDLISIIMKINCAYKNLNYT